MASLNTLRLFKALFLPNFPGPTFVPCPTSTLDSRVGGNNLVCELCKERQLSPEALERHTLGVHGVIGTQNSKGTQFL